MMQSWPEVPIKEVYLGLFDGPHATPPTSDEGPVFLGIGNVTEDGHIDLAGVRHISESDYPTWTRRVTPTLGDIVFTYEATLNRYAIVPAGFRGCLGRRMALIRPDPSKIDTRFLHYTFFAPEWRATIEQYRLAGATVDRIPLTKFPDFPIRLPPLPTQRKIAAILSAYDDLIENNTRRVQVLEQMARDLYREWFVEFRFPGHETTEFVDDEHGRRPEGWERVKVADVALVHRGRSYKKENLVADGGQPFITLKCIDRDGGFRLDGIKRYEGPLKPSQTAVAGEIVMGVTDMTQERRLVARAARIPRLSDKAAISMDLVKIAPRSDVKSAYLYGMFRFSDFADEVKQHANGANVLHLSPDRITDFGFTLAPAALRDQYAALAEEFYTEVDVLNLKNANLRRTRDFLLPKLVSGELDVSALDVRGPGLEPVVDVTDQTPEAVA